MLNIAKPATVIATASTAAASDQPGVAMARVSSRSWPCLAWRSQPGSIFRSARLRVSKASGGVITIATASEARVAMMKAAARGEKNAPCKPCSSRTGRSTRASITVA